MLRFDFKQTARSFLMVWAFLVASIPSVLSQELRANDHGDRISRLTPCFEIQLPSGSGPFPIMIMVTGCSGFHNERFSGSYERDSNLFVELGYAVARADYVRAHGLENSCTGDQNPTGEIVPDDEIAAYIWATVAHMAAQSDIDANRIYLLGWSLGGGGILTAMANTDLLGQHPIEAVLNYSPRCQGQSHWNAEVPMLLMLAELDNITPPQYCRELMANAVQAGTVEIIEYDDAHHCFAAEDTPVVTEPRLESTCAYSPQAYSASWRDILNYLEAR